MNETIAPSQVARFGVFEADLRTRELRKRGLRLKLEEKPFQILELLLERAGELVTREALREKLWPDTFVGFDRSLNTAINKLRQVLGDLAVNPRFVETRPRRGYRFIAPVEMPGAGMRSSPQPSEAIDSIAVLPFQNAGGDPEMEYLSDGLTESLIHSLSQLPEVRVMARSTVFRYKGREVDPQTVGRDLNIRVVLTGKVVRRNGTLIIGTELVDVDNGWRLWGEQYNRKLSDIIVVQEEIAKEISEKLRLRLTGGGKKRLGKRYTENTDAYRDYLKGRYYWNKMTEEGLKKSIGYFEQAIQKDPNYALAYAGLADSHSLFGFFSLLPPKEVMPRAKEAALKALAIDDGLAEAHASLAGIKKVYDWDWLAAEREYQRALELNPNYATAHHWYADYLSAVGRSQEALAEIQRAQELDPLSLVISMEVAWNLYMAREYDRAVEQSLKTLEMESDFSPAHYTLGLAYEQVARYEEAIAALQEARNTSGGNPVSLAALGHAYATAGRRREAMKTLNELRKISERSYVSPYWSAILYAGLGENAPAFEWLEKAYEERDVWLVWLKAEPRFDSLRSDPQFEDLLRRVGLLQAIFPASLSNCPGPE